MAEPRTYNKRRDLKDPLNREAEDRIKSALELSGRTVIDCRHLNCHWDFQFQDQTGLWTIDAKRDKHIEYTDRVPFEETIKYPNGYERLSWGWDDDLHFLAVTGVTMRKAYIVRLPELRIYVKAKRAFFEGGTPGWWIPFWPKDEETGEQAFGYAIPRKELGDIIAGVLTLRPLR